MTRLLRLAVLIHCQPPAAAAPLRVVAPGDKKGARWPRMVTSIEVVSMASKP